MTIKEMLIKRDTVELLRMLRSKALPFPIDVAKEDETRILAAYYDENDRTIPFLLEYLEEDEPDWDEYEMTEDKLKILKDNHYRQLELAGFVKNIEDKREDMCMALSDKLTDEMLMADAYLNMPDESVDIMRRVISDGKRKGDHQELDVDIKGDDKYPVELLRNLGTGPLRPVFFI